MSRAAEARARPARQVYPQKARVFALAHEVQEVLASDGRIAAVRAALAGADDLLREPTEAVRSGLRQLVFAKLLRHGVVSYQVNDFECYDYQLFDIADDLPTFRGPAPSPEALAGGDYFCVIGAAQTFGRLVARPYGALMSEALGLPVLSLSRGGVGPDLFLDDRLMRLIRGARFIILQVVSGRSVGCPDYPGDKKVQLDGGEQVERKRILERLWREDRGLAIHYVRRWNATYLEVYRQLRERIDRPILLLWFSERTPRAWWPGVLKKRLTWGAFPQLVGEELYERMCELFPDHHEAVTGKTSEPIVSRVTGQPCPYFGDNGSNPHHENTYYPSSASHAALAAALLPWARAALNKPLCHRERKGPVA